ncbi:MAG: hypothetical protein ACK4K7_16190 [Allosphingosinicella sp.]|uniref:hypothetical protein n=1 Tax=Allosphingosinicella sp. TaxID=2823234 RepID=UPI003948DBAA
MRKALAGTGLAMIMALAACGPGGPATPENVAIDVPDSAEYQQQLAAMPEGQRNAVFIRALQDAGHGNECQQVESSTQAGEEQGFPVWQVRCRGDSVWKVIIANDGVAQVMRSAEDAELGVGGNVLGPESNQLSEPGAAAGNAAAPPAGNQTGQ